MKKLCATKSDDDTERQLVHTLAHAIVFIVSIFISKTSGAQYICPLSSRTAQRTNAGPAQAVTEEHRELQADSGQQGLETPPHEPGPPTGLREGLARAQEAVGPRCRPRGPRPAEQVGRAVKAPPRRTPAGGARRASAQPEMKSQKPPQM